MIQTVYHSISTTAHGASVNLKGSIVIILHTVLMNQENLLHLGVHVCNSAAQMIMVLKHMIC